MSNYPLYWVDAFTDRPLSGNPCAVLLDTDDLDVTTMQSIARETNLSETAFVRTSQSCDFAVRYFTPAEEIPMAGHPTIATTHALWQAGLIPLQADLTHIQLELIGGPIGVTIQRRETPDGKGAPDWIIMTQRRPVFMTQHDPDEVLACFGLTAEDVLPGVPIQTVSTGTPQLMIPLRDHEALRRARINVDAYSALRARSDFFSPHLFCLGGVTPDGATFARHFGVSPDTSEDPVTGSATGGMGAYLWHYGLIEHPRFLAQQGHWLGRAGVVQVEVVGARDAIETVRIGGQAAGVITGQFTLG